MKVKLKLVSIFIFIISSINYLSSQDIDSKSSFLVAGISMNIPKNNRFLLYGGYSPTDNVKAIVALPNFKINKYLTLTPGYTFVNVKPEGGSTLIEHQILAMATVSVPIVKNWTIADRNMYFYRFRKRLEDLSFYRNRLGITHKTELLKKELSIYLHDEIFLNLDNGVLSRNRIILGGEIKLLKWLSPQLMYMYQSDKVTGNRHLGWIIFTVPLENFGLFN